MMETIKKYRVDVRRSKRGRIIQSYWTDSANVENHKGYFISIYQYFGKRLFKVASFNAYNEQK